MAALNAIFTEQLRAVAFLRWRLFTNSLRSVRGRLNLVSRSIAGLLVLGAAAGGGTAIGIAAWGITRDGRLLWLAVPLWMIFIFWQLFPVMATAFTQNVDTSALLRYPLRYSGYFLIRMVYGSLDIATALGLSWSAGLLAGISVGDLRLTPWALVSVGAFVAFNLLLARAIFVWIEHWLASRRSREILGVLFLLAMLAFQVIGPALDRYSRRPAAQRFHVIERLIPLEESLPPGLAARALIYARAQNHGGALRSLAFIILFCAGAVGLLHLRLRAQYRGEVLSGGEKVRKLTKESVAPREGWNLPVLSGPVVAVFEKELRYFSRSGPMLFTLIMPVVMLFVLWGTRKSFIGSQFQFFFPVGVAYSLLVMTNIVYNSFGGDGAGIQFFLFAPVKFSHIAGGKNLAHLMLLLLDVTILWFGVQVIYRAPSPSVLALTVAWVLFAAPANFAAGNCLSLYAPKRIEFSTFGRQRASELTIFISLGIQLAVVGVGATAVTIARRCSNLWVGTAVLLALAIPSVLGYFLVLRRMGDIAMRRREVLVTELCKT